MNINDRIRFASRDIIKTFTKFVKIKIDENDVKFINSGVDNEVSRYKALFLKTLATMLNFSYDDEYGISDDVVDICIDKLESMIKDKGYSMIAKSHSDILFLTCENLYTTIEKEVFSDELQI